MTILELSIIGVGGFIGAVIRYLISKWNRTERFPIGTLIVNLVGCLLIGFVFGMGLSKFWTLFLASGFAGALTTFSTMNKEIIELWQLNKKKEAIVYILSTFVAGTFLTFAGFSISSGIN